MALQTLRRIGSHAGLAKAAYRLKRADDEHARAIAREHLIERMGKLRGLPQKLGQMLSFTKNAEDSDSSASEQYAVLQESAEPLPFKAVRPVLDEAWGKQHQEIVQSIEPVAHAASLGQVHRATLKDGREVAVKIQYPKIRESIQADLKMLGWLSVPVGNLKRGFDLNSYRTAITEDLERELDYLQEAQQQEKFYQLAQENPFLAVPQVIKELSTENVLVTAWEEGDTWADVKSNYSEQEKRKLATGLVKFFLEGLFLHGRMHADWHPGNVRFRRNQGEVQLLLYDFGCVYTPNNEHRLALLRLIRSTVLQDESPWPLFMKLGFQREFLQPLAKKLPALCRVLFEPFAAQYPYEAKDWQLGTRVGDVLGNDRWNFRIAGPAELVFLLRAFQGLIFYLEGLNVPVFWSRITNDLLQELSPQLDVIELEQDAPNEHDFSTLAQHLKIRVTENQQVKVELTSNASGIDNLESLLDDDLQNRITQQGYDLKQIVSNVRSRGYTPGKVFELTEGKKNVSVWLQ